MRPNFHAGGARSGRRPTAASRRVKNYVRATGSALELSQAARRRPAARAPPVRRRAWVSCPRRAVARARLCHLLGAALARRTRRCLAGRSSASGEGRRCRALSSRRAAANGAAPPCRPPLPPPPQRARAADMSGCPPRPAPLPRPARPTARPPALRTLHPRPLLHPPPSRLRAFVPRSRRRALVLAEALGRGDALTCSGLGVGLAWLGFEP